MLILLSLCRMALALGLGLRAIDLKVNTEIRVRAGYCGVLAENRSQVL